MALWGLTVAGVMMMSGWWTGNKPHKSRLAFVATHAGWDEQMEYKRRHAHIKHCKDQCWDGVGMSCVFAYLLFHPWVPGLWWSMGMVAGMVLPCAQRMFALFHALDACSDFFTPLSVAHCQTPSAPLQ